MPFSFFPNDFRGSAKDRPEKWPKSQHVQKSPLNVKNGPFRTFKLTFGAIFPGGPKWHFSDFTTFWGVSGFWSSDILFSYRSPSDRPHHDPTQHPRNGPETDPEQTRNGAKRIRTEPNGAEMDRNQALTGGTAGGGFVGMGRGGGL